MNRETIATGFLVLLLLSHPAGAVGGPTTADDVELPPIEPAADRHWTTFSVWLEEDGSARARITVSYANEDEPLDASETPYSDPERRDRLRDSLTDAMSRLERTADERTSREMSVEFVGQRPYSHGERRVSYRFNYRWENFAAVDGDRYVVDQPLAGDHSIFHDVFRFDLTPPRDDLYALDVASDGHERTKLGGRLDGGVSDWIQFTAVDDLTGYEAVFAPVDSPTPTHTEPTATESTATETPTRVSDAADGDEPSRPLFEVIAALLVVLLSVVGVVRRRRR